MFHTYRQNNSEGIFLGPTFVCVEADTLDEADERAEQSGFVYFNGVRKGKDCACCGDRWSCAYDADDLTETPTAYGKPLFNQSDFVIVHRNGEITKG